MLINETLKTFVPTVKPQEAKVFYRDILGLTLLAEDAYGMEFDSGGSLLRVITVRERPPHEFTILGWNVVDIEATLDLLVGVAYHFRNMILLITSLASGHHPITQK